MNSQPLFLIYFFFALFVNGLSPINTPNPLLPKVQPFSDSNPAVKDLNTGFIGCFIDGDAPNRDMGSLVVYSGATAADGRNFCSSFKYFGLQDRGQLYCSNTFGNYASYVQVDDSECNLFGFQTGGSWRNAVFLTGFQPSTTTTSSTTTTLKPTTSTTTTSTTTTASSTTTTTSATTTSANLVPVFVAISTTTSTTTTTLEPGNLSPDTVIPEVITADPIDPELIVTSAPNIIPNSSSTDISFGDYISNNVSWIIPAIIVTVALLLILSVCILRRKGVEQVEETTTDSVIIGIDPHYSVSPISNDLSPSKYAHRRFPSIKVMIVPE